MPPTELSLSMSATSQLQFFDPDFDKSARDASQSATSASSDEAWQELLDQLTDWGRNAASVDEDGFQFPTLEAIKKTFDWLKALKKRVNLLPQRVVAAGDGGIAIELLSSPAHSLTLDVDDSGQAQFLEFENCELVRRSQLH